jgi:hypothetical protein
VLASILSARVPTRRHYGLSISFASINPNIIHLWLTLRARDNLARARCNVYASDQLVMSTQLVLELEACAAAGMEFDNIVTRNSQRLAVGREGVISDWVMEKVVYFGRGHCECDRRSSLLPLFL